MSSIGGLTAERQLPPYYSTAIRPQLRNHGATPVLFFPGCYIRYNNPRLGQIVVDLLALNGFSVNVASDICCGMPAIANGDTAQLNACVENNVTEMVEAVDRGALIVTACTSCGYALKGDYAHLLQGHQTLAYAAQKVSGATYDLGRTAPGTSASRKAEHGFCSDYAAARLPRALPHEVARHRPSMAAAAAGRAGNSNRRNQGRLLRDGRYVRIQEGKIRYLDGHRS